MSEPRIVWDIPEDMTEREVQLFRLCLFALQITLDLFGQAKGAAGAPRASIERVLEVIATTVPGTNPRLH